jgi:hypothetical protein
VYFYVLAVDRIRCSSQSSASRDHVHDCSDRPSELRISFNASSSLFFWCGIYPVLTKKHNGAKGRRSDANSSTDTLLDSNHVIVIVSFYRMGSLPLLHYSYYRRIASRY